MKILLSDNGSSRAASTLSLRHIAERLSERIGQRVDPVSLQHADKAPLDELGNEPAWILSDYLRTQLENGERDFLLLPLLFGKSRAITQFIPEQIAGLGHDSPGNESLGSESLGNESETRPSLNLRVADELCPMPSGETLLAELLLDHVGGAPLDHLLLVDHGSPIPEVTAVRAWLSDQIRAARPELRVAEAAMERRRGRRFDFNGELLADALQRIGAEQPQARVRLLLLFLSPGSHAGPDGDIAQIVAAAREQHPNLTISISPLVGEHPGLIEILAKRWQAALARRA